MYYYNTLYTKSDNVRTSRYTNNHAGERVVKSHGDMEGVYINGAPQGITFHETDEYTLYPASIISVNKNRFTKHYFIGDKRIASRIGSGQFNNVYGRNGCYVTAGQQDYAERINQIEQQREEYYKELGIPPGVPTMKGAYGDPENTGVGYNTIITELGDHSVPKNWEQYVVKREPGETPGPPIIWGEPQSPEEVEPGYGYVSDDTAEEETFFYHSDHLGSTSYITDQDGNITQYTAYLPYGELLVDEHSSSEELPYKFNGKELDEETGLYYYGARYLNPISSVWYGVDKLVEKYPHIGGYVYCIGNPIKLLDTNGKDWIKYNNTYSFNPLVKNQEDVNRLYGEDYQYLFAEGKLFASDHSYSYSLESDGQIRNTITNEIVMGEITTPGGSVLVNNHQYFIQHNLSFMEKWAQSDNFFAAFAYGILNDLYVGLQAFSFGMLQKEEWKNPFTGACFGNLDGSPNYNQTDAIPGIVTNLFPASKTVKGFTPLKKLNAADFSKLFKGTLSKLKPATRGSINKGINIGIEKINNKIGTGQVLLDGTDAMQTTLNINEKKNKND